MTVCTPPKPRFVTYGWLANVASCDAQTFFNNNIGFCSFGQDPQVQQSLKLISNCYKTILASEKTIITIVSNKIQKKATNTNSKKKILPLHVKHDAHHRLPHQVPLPPSVANTHLVQQMCHIVELAELQEDPLVVPNS